METPNSYQIDMQVNVQFNEQAGSLINDILAAATTASILADTVKAIVVDVVRSRCSLFIAIYSNAGFEDFKEHLPVGVVETI